MTQWRYLFVSLAIHVILGGMLYELANIQAKSSDVKNLEIQIVENKKTQMHTLVPTVPSQKRLNLKPNFPAPEKVRASEVDQVVKKETRAPNLGDYNPITSTSGSGEEQKEKLDIKHSDDESNKLSEMGKKLFVKEASDPAFYENTEVGSITALNAEGIQFYAFNNRIMGPIYNGWIRNLRYYQSRWGNSEIEKLNGKTWTTQIEVILDSNGFYKDFNLYGPSGVNEIDVAVIRTFKSIGYFPNPPRELVKEDGTIRLRYAFNFIVPPARQMAGAPYP